MRKLTIFLAFVMLLTFASAEYSLRITADSITEAQLEINNVLAWDEGNGVFKLNTSESNEDVARAQIMKTLFYGTDGSNPRSVSGITNAHKIVVYEERDYNKSGYYMQETFTGDGTTTFTLDSTTSNPDVSSWSNIVHDAHIGSSATTKWRVGGALLHEKSTGGGGSDETGLNLTADQRDNPTTVQTDRGTASAAVTGNTYAYWLSAHNGTWTAGTPTTWTDFLGEENIPVFSYLTNNNVLTEALKGQNITINFTAKDRIGLANASLYIGGTINETITITGNENETVFTKNFTTNGNKVWNLEVCDTNADCFYSGNNTLEVKSVTVNSNTYNSNVLTESNQNFTLNITVFGSVTSALFVYNGTSYSATVDNQGDYTLIKMVEFSVPAVNATTNYDFSWNITTSDSVQTEITEETQTVTVIDIDDCSSYTNVVYNFTIVDEKTQTKLGSTTSEVDMDFYAFGTTNLVGEFSQNYSTNSFAVCIDSALNDNIEVDAQVLYTATGYATEFYNLQQDLVTNANQHQNITLYSLDNTSATTFTIFFKDSSFIPVENALIQVGRKYISEGVFKTVEQPATDSNGEALVHLELENVIYTFTVIVDGKVDSIFNNVKASCPNPALEPCEIELNSINSFVNLLDFSRTTGLTFAFDFQRDTRDVSVIYSVLSGASETVTLNVSLFDSLGNTSICSDELTSSSGTLTCNVPNSFGNTTIIADLHHEGKHVGQAVISMAQNPSDLYGANIVFVGLLIIISLTGISLVGNPIISGLFLILSAIILMTLNLVTSTGWIGAGATILWFIVAVVIVIIKGANR
jgi:hypothetical protein